MPHREDFQKLFSNILLGIVEDRYYFGETKYKRNLATIEESSLTATGI